MEDFEDLLNRYVLCDAAILERVDEYTLYCKYLGFEPMLKTKYSSFIRTGDPDPSFSMFDSNKAGREYFWKDNGIGEAGDIFKLIRMMFGLNSTADAYRKIDHDFQLGFNTEGPPPENKIILNSLKDRKPETRIRIQSKPFTVKDLTYWASFGITLPTLERYKVKSLRYFWMSDFQEFPQVPKNLSFAYEVLKKYKIYQPLMPSYKFRNDFHEQCLEGFAQLTYQSDTLIITKSNKDIMTLRELGYEAVSPRSENTPVPEPYMRHFAQKYPKRYVLFDNDMKHRGDMYQEPKVYVPLNSGTKDISDFRKAYGAKLTKELLQTIIQ